MELIRLDGQTYAIDGPTVVGVYVFADDTCLLVDTGADEKAGTRVLAVLEQNGLTVRAVMNTHFHADHCGGNRIIQEKTGCEIMVSRLDACLVENPILGPVGVFSAFPPRVLLSRFMMPDASRVTCIMEPGEVVIGGETFHILDLSGHTLGHIGVRTPDGTTFLGDSLLSPELLGEVEFNYLTDVRAQLATLDRLEKQDVREAVLAHGGAVADIKGTIKSNRAMLNRVSELILTFLESPKSREEVVAHAISSLGLPDNQTQYYLIAATVSAFLGYLANEKLIRGQVRHGIARFVRTT